MPADQLSIEMLQADHGDALWVEWGTPEDRHRMLIDGGTKRTFDELKRRFLQLNESERRLDLLVVTHIDLDHVDGVIELLRDEKLKVRYDDIWFNGYKHLTSEPPGSASRGAVQGEFVSAVLSSRGLPWNCAFDDGAIVVPTTGSLPAVTLDGGLRLVLLSPTPEKLEKLHKKWEETLEDAKYGLQPDQRDEWLAVLEERRGPAERSAGVRFGADGSEANGSSIAFIAEYNDERWLLAGDAHNDVLLAGLQRYAADTGEQLPVKLDGFKLPHHGSVRNISPDLFDAMRARKFLISSSGAYFKHPDEAAIELVIERSDRPELEFNYATEFTEKWSEASDRYATAYLHGADSRNGTEPAVVQPPAEQQRAEDDSQSEQPTRAVVEHVAGTIDESDATPAGPPIRVTVHHGSLDQADHPVIVGHYLATSLSGAEGFVDRRFDGRLSERLDRNTYVGDIGEYVYIPAPGRRLPTEGVLVVGLGEYGELTPLRLVEAVREALVRHALDVADRDQGTGPLKLGVSSVLIAATGSHGLTVAASANAIVDAVREANRDLRGGSGKVRAQYTDVQIFERNAPEAELAYLALHDDGDEEESAQRRVGQRELIRPEQLLEAGGGLHNSLPSDTAEAPWWRIRISHDTTKAGESDPGHYLDLGFAVGGRLARAGVVRHQVERRRLERMLRNAVGEKAMSSGLHTTLFELLFPRQLKWDLMAAQDIQLEVDDTTADIPWEMLAARNPKEGTRGELALRSPLVRQLRVDVSGAIARSSKKTALVIGNPPVGKLGPTLEGAYDEAKAVVDVLEGADYHVKAHCHAPDVVATGDSTMRIESALFEDDYRIVHMAAHGVLQPDDPTRTGVAIGPDDFVTASVLGQLNVTPDLVFLNCCHVGALQTGIQTGPMDFTRRNLNRLAASLARQLIRSGVRAVIVAGWAVDDAAATRFAKTFYEKMLDGVPFGRAVHTARHAAMALPGEPQSSTWGAYQCYGDAGYRLPDSDRRNVEASLPATRREVLRRLESFVGWIETIGVGGDDSDRDLAVYELEALEKTARENGWLSRKPGHLAEEFANAWGALGQFEQAIEFYEMALAAADGQVTMKAVEQLANLSDRWATELMRKPNPNDDERNKAQELIADSLHTIQLLECISRSGERGALRAGHFKRRAAIAATNEERLDSLHQAVEGYRTSYIADPQPYTLFNYVQLDQIRSRMAGADPASSELREEYLSALKESKNYIQSRGDYWDAVALADGTLTEAIENDAVDGAQDSLVDLYLGAFECRSTAKVRASTLDHLLDLADIHPDSDQRAALQKLCAELRTN